jgi:hypothetical protein
MNADQFFVFYNTGRLNTRIKKAVSAAAFPARYFG